MWSRFCICYVSSRSARPSRDHRTGKGQSSSRFPRRAAPKNVLTIGLALIFHAHKVTLKILHFRLQDYVKNQELPEVQAGFRKGRGTRDQIANICWIIEKAKEFQKNFISSIMQKPLTVWIMTTCGKLLERWEYQTILPVSWETCMQAKKQQLEPCIELIGSRFTKEYNRAVCCHPVCLPYTLSTS